MCERAGMVRGAGRVRSGRGGTGPTAAPPRVPPGPDPARIAAARPFSRPGAVGARWGRPPPPRRAAVCWGEGGEGRYIS